MWNYKRTWSNLTYLENTFVEWIGDNTRNYCICRLYTTRDEKWISREDVITPIQNKRSLVHWNGWQENNSEHNLFCPLYTISFKYSLSEGVGIFTFEIYYYLYTLGGFVFNILGCDQEQQNEKIFKLEMFLVTICPPLALL